MRWWFATPSRSLWRHCNERAKQSLLRWLLYPNWWESRLSFWQPYTPLMGIKQSTRGASYFSCTLKRKCHFDEIFFTGCTGDNFRYSQWWKFRQTGNISLQCIPTTGASMHYNDVIMSVMVSQIAGVLIVHSTVCSVADQRKHQSSASVAFVRGNSPVTGEFPAQRASNAENVSFGDVIM